MRRPPGVYEFEPFGDDLLFWPGFAVVESPIENVSFFAEPLPRLPYVVWLAFAV